MVTVALLMTDVQGSTSLWETQTEAMRTAMRYYDELVAEVVQQQGGTLVKDRGEGDSHFIVADQATTATRIAVELQRRIADKDWPVAGKILTRMALHVGSVEVRDQDYYGPVVNRCARIRSAGHGGQILASSAVRALVEDSGFKLTDLGVHRLKDLERPEQIYQVDAAGLVQAFPQLLSLEVSPNNLPIQLTSFVGREEERASVRDLLARHRLVSLLGPGGVGKSRLATQVAGELIDDYPDGVWFVELAPITDPSLLVTTISSVLSVRDGSSGGVEAIVNEIAAKEVLLILDNCEHLVDDVVELIPRLLAGCPQVRILVTSREALGISGEAVFRVPSLSTADGTGAAEQLFVERASAITSFVLTQESLPWVLQICKRLDGIPFAIELAAARVKVLTPRQIAERLDDRFRLLTASGRGALPRHQTLRALIDWSYDSLEPTEQQLLRELSVFAGTFGFESVSDVCTSCADEFEALDMLSGLVEKSLVQVLEAGDRRRYRLLESVRQYCREKLSAEELEGVLDRHYSHFESMAEAEASKLTGAGQGEALVKLEDDHDNLRAALDWTIHRPDLIERSRMLAGHLARFWFLRGYFSEGRDRFRSLLLGTEGQTSPGIAKCLSGDGILAWRTNKFDEAEHMHGQALNVRRTLGDEPGIADSLSNLGLVALAKNNFDAAEGFLIESLSIRERLGETFGQANSLNNLGILMWRQERLDEAANYYQRCLALREQMGDHLGRADTLHNLALIYRGQGQYDKALKMHEDALGLHEEGSSISGQITVLDNMALVYLHMGDPKASRACAEKSLSLNEKAGDLLGAARARLYLASCDIAEEQDATAKSRLEKLLQDGWPELTASVYYGLASLETGPAREAFLEKCIRAEEETGHLRAEMPPSKSRLGH